MSLVRHIETESAFNELLDAKSSSGALVVVKWSAQWCQPCHAISPHIDEFSKSYPQVTFVKVDTDKFATLAQKYNVTAMPTFHFIKNKSVVETVKGANKEAIRAAIVKHMVGAVASGSGSEPSDISLLEFLDRPQINCLNESTEHTFKSIMSGSSRNTSAAYLESDVDEQLILNIPFNQTVRIRGISIKCSEESQAPKLIKLTVNTPNVGFDEVEDAVEPQVAQIIELDADTVTSGKTIPLRFVRFQNVLSLHIFVGSNQGSEDNTRIDSIDIFGLPGQTSRVSELRAREEH
ncbi:hypothetical protein M408DRAFT_18669 [Serendipita vermifera MAFF 305830]|uniref:Thioredoxin n=1 Tax=Serendipita vermifera MAFF 305830 TaxID=933852 RepID=A0A0C3A5I1_SERVB|nr:hypothetical protein M408DRAFT_18669 [Serendipita vermifera MAFF 305830]